ncbi:hypothetical protein BFX05_03795 [Sulfobacillus thermosulfidooxidans]|nr:hypothetical protein BFX05_03795 [Sulfobacillus thermosulfidooxidans]
MPMIPLSVEFLQGGFEVLTHIRKDRPQVLYDCLGKDQPPIFRHKDQMHVQVKYTMSTRSVVAGVCHRPRVKYL